MGDLDKLRFNYGLKAMKINQVSPVLIFWGPVVRVVKAGDTAYWILTARSTAATATRTMALGPNRATTVKPIKKIFFF